MAEFYAANPLWTWMIVGGVLLAIEVATGSGWLLWPAACAAVTALVALILPGGLPAEIAVFSVMTIATTLLARRFIPEGRLHPGSDINDRTSDLVGKSGRVTTAFVEGRGRVLVDGAEWEAEADDTPMGAIVVVDVLGGARLKVRSASA